MYLDPFEHHEKTSSICLSLVTVPEIVHYVLVFGPTQDPVKCKLMWHKVDVPLQSTKRICWSWQSYSIWHSHCSILGCFQCLPVDKKHFCHVFKKSCPGLNVLMTGLLDDGHGLSLNVFKDLKWKIWTYFRLLMIFLSKTLQKLWSFRI